MSLPPVRGPLGYRALTFKVDGTYASPLFPDFIWAKNGVAEAECPTCREDCPGLPKSWKARLPQPLWPHCTCASVLGQGCGIYAAKHLSIATPYAAPNRVLLPTAMLLVEGRGKFILLEGEDPEIEAGFKCRQALIRAVVWLDFARVYGTTQIGQFEQATHAAARYFGRQMVTLAAASAA